VTPAAVRVAVIVVCAAGIAGMIVGSIADNNAVALTFGLITAAAVACLIVATAVTDRGGIDDARAARVEEMAQTLIVAGADETAVRDLVREAVRQGRGGR
jgi:ABC-type Na+ efflux pump permease subunit